MLIIAVHQESREFAAKFFLAYQASRRFGSAALCRTSRLPDIANDNEELILMDVALTPKRGRLFEGYREQGHRIIAFDEEASAAASLPESRLHPDAVRHVDGLVLWGSYHESLLGGRVPNDKLIRSGHPRLEVARPKNVGIFARELESIRRHGPYVLWITDTRNYQFHEVSSAYRDHVAQINRKSELDGYPHEVSSPVDFENSFKELEDRLRQQARLVEELRDELGLRIIIRPRPTVSQRVLQQQLRAVGYQTSNTCCVTSAFAVTPWISAARLVIQHGCTTAIESAAAETTAISFPRVPSAVMADVPFLVAPGADGALEALELVKTVTEKSHSPLAIARQAMLLPEAGSSGAILDWLEASLCFGSDNRDAAALRLRSPRRRLRSQMAAAWELIGKTADNDLPSHRNFDRRRANAYLMALNSRYGLDIRATWISSGEVVALTRA